MVLGKLAVPGRPTIWITVGQGPTALAVGAGGGCLDIFTLDYPFCPLSPSPSETARYRLKYSLKGPLNPKQPINQPNRQDNTLQRIHCFTKYYSQCQDPGSSSVSLPQHHYKRQSHNQSHNKPNAGVSNNVKHRTKSLSKYLITNKMLNVKTKTHACKCVKMRHTMWICFRAIKISRQKWQLSYSSTQIRFLSSNPNKMSSRLLAYILAAQIPNNILSN